MILKIILTLIACCASAWLYRAGGQGKPYNTKFRDMGCPLVFLCLFWACFGFKIGFWWAYLLTFGLSFGFMTTYWDFLFGYDNFWAHGFMLGLAALPLMIGIAWWLILIRAVFLALGMGLWSKWIGSDVWEERGRGFIYIL